MSVTAQTFQQYQAAIINNMAASLGISTNLPQGDPLLAIAQALTAQLIYVQGQNQSILAASRAATATGSDLDSWMADFGYTRSPATYAWGPFQVTASTNLTPTGGVSSLPFGTVVNSSDGTVSYTIIPQPSAAVTTTPAQTIALYGGTPPTSTTPGGTYTVYAQANNIGTVGNVAGGFINALASPVAGVSAVSNLSAVTNGAAAATDAAARAGFLNYIQSLSQATYGAVQSAIAAVIPGTLFSLLDTAIAPTANPAIPPGTIETVYADPNPSLQGQFTTGATSTTAGTILAAMNKAEAFGIVPLTYAGTQFGVNIQVAYTRTAGSSAGVVAAAVTAALVAAYGPVSSGGHNSPFAIGPTTLNFDQLVKTVNAVTGVQECNVLTPPPSPASQSLLTGFGLFNNSYTIQPGFDAVIPSLQLAYINTITLNSN